MYHGHQHDDDDHMTIEIGYFKEELGLEIPTKYRDYYCLFVAKIGMK